MYFKSVLIVTILVTVSTDQVTSNEEKTLYTNEFRYSQYFPLKENLAEGTTLRFSVRAPRDAHILFATEPRTDKPVYEIILGAENNTINFIKGRYPCYEEPLARVRTVRLLTPHEFRNLWIRFKTNAQRTSTKIQVGIGGEDASFLEWRDTQPVHPQYLSFTSGTPAEWRYGYSDTSYNEGLSVDTRQVVVTSNGYGQYYPLSEVVSHSDDGVTLRFTLRTSETFKILLSREVNHSEDAYEVGITDRIAYIRGGHLGEPSAVFQQNGSKEGERRQFWIKLISDGQLILGSGQTLQILEGRDPDPLSPQFVSFSLDRAEGGNLDTSGFADLQYGLGPDYTLASQDCSPRLKQVSGKLPPGAVRGGLDIDLVESYICSTSHNGVDYAPGSFVPEKDGKGTCKMTWGGHIYPKSDFKALTGCRFTWAKTVSGEFRRNAVDTGKVTDNSGRFIGRVTIDGQTIIAKVKEDFTLAYAAFNGLERHFTIFEVLVDRISKL